MAGLALFATLVACAHRVPPPVAAPPPLVLPASIDEVRAIRQAGDLDRYELGLKLLALSPDLQVGRRALALLGIFYFEQKRWNDTVATLTTAAGIYPEIAPFLRLRIAEAEEQRRDVAKAAVVVASIVRDAPQSSASTVARLRLPMMYAKLGNRAATDVAFQEAGVIAIDELTENDFVDLADGLEQGGRPELAGQIEMRLLTEYPQGRFTEKTYAVFSLQHEDLLDGFPSSDLISLASKLGREDHYDQALDLLERVARRYPEMASDERYRAVRLRALFSSHHYSQLLDETANARLKDPALLLLRARAAWRSGKPEELLAGLRQIEREFPSSQEAIEAKLLRARYYTSDETDYERAATNLEAAIDAGALGNDGENLWTLGWVFTLWHHDNAALATFDRYLQIFPDADFTSNALFWSAKIFDRKGKLGERDAKFAELIAKYPFSYFSYRAREIRAREAPSPLRQGEAVHFPDIATLPNDSRLMTVDELEAIGLSREASREMKLLAAACPDDLGVAFKLADVYARGGEPFKANGILQRRFRDFVRHGGEAIPQRFWEILFPLHYWETIRAEAARYSLDPYLVASIIRQESGFETYAVSNAGAVGLMQIMPAEAPRIGERAGIKDVTREKLFDPRFNIAIGVAELEQKLQQMQGNQILAIAAYNAGEEAVGRWIAHTPVDDIDLFVESIPYAETRLYVKTVERNRFEYRRIYESRTQVPERPAQ